MEEEVTKTEYPFKDAPLAPPVVEYLALELFPGELVELQVLEKELVQAPVSRGGKPPEPGAFNRLLRKALPTMKQKGRVLGTGPAAVYLYYLPVYRLRAEEQNDKFWPCKIGRTDRDPVARVLA